MLKHYITRIFLTPFSPALQTVHVQTHYLLMHDDDGDTLWASVDGAKIDFARLKEETDLSPEDED